MHNPGPEEYSIDVGLNGMPSRAMDYFKNRDPLSRTVPRSQL